MIPIHATATSNEQQLRWVVPSENLPPAGIVRRAPAALGALLDRGVIDELVIRGADILITLSSGNSWRENGDDIRAALGEALLDPAGWRVDSAAGGADWLAQVANELLDGQIGALAQSHGGSIELVSVVGNTVTVRMSGACHGCPASGSTLYEKLQHELRRRAGEQVNVVEEKDSAATPFGLKLRSLRIR